MNIVKQTVILLTCLLTTFVSLGQNDQIKTMKFEKLLGESESAAMNSLLKIFEEYLMSTYENSSLDTAYSNYVKEIALGNYPIPFSESKYLTASKLYIESGFIESLEDIPDTVWVDKEIIYSVFNNRFEHISDTNRTPLKDCIRYSRYFKNYDIDNLNSEQYDSIIGFSYYQGNNYWVGNFFHSLHKVKQGNKYLSEYLDAGLDVGQVAYSNIAYGFLANNCDFSDYFIRRLIMIEVFIPFLPRLPDIDKIIANKRLLK